MRGGGGGGGGLFLFRARVGSLRHFGFSTGRSGSIGSAMTIAADLKGNLDAGLVFFFCFFSRGYLIVGTEGRSQSIVFLSV